ncbi:hypothetical protein IRJ41_004322 [Triplophysa rosa]|uniref:Uncharacterized protein n=1 Tax=Triplophysa rosa TaxID=992332 RepID=A0A9W7TR65_TRIRA|nr:hypothetical protein IRJ41_004322 [Triplophysa rosa]
METKAFAVVEFADDDSVEIIPTTWLEETTEVMAEFHRKKGVKTRSTYYRTNVLQKLQELCENWQDILSMQRRILTVPGVVAEMDFLENGPCQTIDELKQFDRILESKEKRTNMVINTAIYTVVEL